MKRNISPRQQTTVENRFRGSLNSTPSRGQVGVGKKRVFVFRKTSFLPTTKGQGKRIQRILIFDDHPDSLRLILGPPVKWTIRRVIRERASTRHFLLPGLVIIGALLAMVWPLF
jgi:hypothetical protein